MKLLLLSLALMGCALAYPDKREVSAPPAVQDTDTHEDSKREAGAKHKLDNCFCHDGICLQCYHRCREVSSCEIEYDVLKRDIPDFPDIPPIPPMPEMPPMPDFKREAGIVKRQTHVETCNCNSYNGVGGCEKCVNGNCFQVSSCNGKREVGAPPAVQDTDTHEDSKREAGSEELSLIPCKCESYYPPVNCKACFGSKCYPMPHCRARGKREAGVEKRQTHSEICVCNYSGEIGPCKKCVNGNCVAVSSCNGKREVGAPPAVQDTDTHEDSKREAAQNTAESCNTWDNNLKQMVSGPCKREAGSEEKHVGKTTCECTGPSKTDCKLCVINAPSCIPVLSCTEKREVGAPPAVQDTDTHEDSKK